MFKFESQRTCEQRRHECNIIKFVCQCMSVTQAAQDWLLLFLMREVLISKLLVYSGDLLRSL